MDSLLSAMQLQETCTWHPSSHQPFRQGVPSIRLNVLARLAPLADLAATIERVHGKHEETWSVASMLGLRKLLATDEGYIVRIAPLH